ncbi:hypothetical protein [Eudoraea chungangensis]|uniref:hypothetical protein n=1 Tax=Eudoraea chungangensis TaxID=1481905 RepID=UPI0023EB9767|nr:hypothetical protein [Eudoraea chungangensis]
MNHKSYLKGNPEVFKSLTKLATKEPLLMLNYLKYKDHVSETGLSGKVSYQLYLKAAAPYIKNADAELIFYGSPQLMLIGPEDEALWDEILIVKYETLQGFLDMAFNKDYPSELREQALVDSRLVYCKPQSLNP